MDGSTVYLADSGSGSVAKQQQKNTTNKTSLKSSVGKGISRGAALKAVTANAAGGGGGGGGGGSVSGVEGRSDVESWRVRRSCHGGEGSLLRDSSRAADQGKLLVGSCPAASVAWERPLALQPQEQQQQNLRVREGSKWRVRVDRAPAQLAAYDERFKYSLLDIMALKKSPLVNGEMQLDPEIKV
jgi:hypothetical protein